MTEKELGREQYIQHTVKYWMRIYDRNPRAAFELMMEHLIELECKVNEANNG